jgi:hypothetical protein
MEKPWLHVSGDPLRRSIHDNVRRAAAWQNSDSWPDSGADWTILIVGRLSTS